jgi:hypothetical protein
VRIAPPEDLFDGVERHDRMVWMPAWEARRETVIAGRRIAENCGFGNAFGHDQILARRPVSKSVPAVTGPNRRCEASFSALSRFVAVSNRQSTTRVIPEAWGVVPTGRVGCSPARPSNSPLLAFWRRPVLFAPVAPASNSHSEYHHSAPDLQHVALPPNYAAELAIAVAELVTRLWTGARIAGHF